MPCPYYRNAQRRALQSRCHRGLVGCAVVALIALAPAAVRAEVAPRLQDLIGRASVVAAGEVGDVSDYAAGRLSVAPLRPTKVLKGESDVAAGSALNVIEMRDLPIPPLLERNTRVLAFLAPARKTSFVRNTLPQGVYLQAVGKPPGWIVAESPAELERLADIVGRVVQSSRKRETDPAARRAAVRTLAFDLIAARPPLLVEDGAASLAEIPDLKQTLTSEEQRQLGATLARPDLPPRSQVTLIRAIAAAGLTQLAPDLRKVTSSEGQAAAWQALDKLGQPLSTEQLTEQLKSADAAARSNAVRELLRRDPKGAADLVAPVALRDPDPTVRNAAIRALGNTKEPDALVPLERAFQDASPADRQIVGRAITDVGGRAAAESFARLAFEGSLTSQRYAALLLLLIGTPKDDPLVQKIATEHPNEQVRELVTKGLPESHH